MISFKTDGIFIIVPLTFFRLSVILSLIYPVKSFRFGLIVSIAMLAVLSIFFPVIPPLTSFLSLLISLFHPTIVIFVGITGLSLI
ncbi:MAG: hypothetical protein KKH85_06400, partial [Proteobacteria bacterium]|nr:hypothetical protein [Pseudomonadota bacterium]